MARKRMIDPNYWASSEITGLSLGARLLFIGFWNFADDGGVMPADTKRLKLRVWPDGEFNLRDVMLQIEELLKAGLIVEYIANDSRMYWQAVNWAVYQKIDRPRFQYPPADSDCTFDPRGLLDRNKTADLFGKLKARLDDISTNSRRALDPNRKEEKRKEVKIKEINKNKNNSPGDGSPIALKIPLKDGTDYDITADMVAEWVRTFPAVDVRQQLSALREWNIATAQIDRKSRPFILRHVITWLSKHQDTARRDEITATRDSIDAINRRLYSDLDEIDDPFKVKGG
ncbi:MAG: hypothetical protein OEW37_00095 [Rhodospirillaceae bacterium]|nr:hypothetical protein [Rhodospirillaceae bacterium]